LIVFEDKQKRLDRTVDRRFESGTRRAVFCGAFRDGKSVRIEGEGATLLDRQ
jgi:hypothetical protein